MICKKLENRSSIQGVGSGKLGVESENSEVLQKEECVESTNKGVRPMM